jgi:hypothetical protein
LQADEADGVVAEASTVSTVWNFIAPLSPGTTFETHVGISSW